MHNRIKEEHIPKVSKTHHMFSLSPWLALQAETLKVQVCVCA